MNSAIPENEQPFAADVDIQKIIHDEMIQIFYDNRDVIRRQSKQQIIKMQNENKHSYL